MKKYIQTMAFLIIALNMLAQDFKFHSDNPFGINILPEDSTEYTYRILFYDIDNDEDFDLIKFTMKIGEITNLNVFDFEYSIDLLENIGSRTAPFFSTKQAFLTELEIPSGLFLPSIADINNDGLFDVIVNGEANEFSGAPQLLFYMNMGQNSFEKRTATDFNLTEFPYQSMLIPDVADFDMDGDNDILLCGVIPKDLEDPSPDGRCIYAKNIGSSAMPQFIGWFDNPYDIKTDTLTELFYSGDIDSDGDLDLLTTVIDEVEGTTQLYIKQNTPDANNRPNFSASMASPYGLPSLEDSLAVLNPIAADLDGDGDKDFFCISANEEGAFVVKYFENTDCVPAEIMLQVEICDGESFEMGGVDYNSTGLYEYSTLNAAGCDSTVFLDLTVYEFNMAISQNENVLTGVDGQGMYQWIDCDSGNAIQGENGFEFTVLETGSYALEIVNNIGCSEISDCVEVLISSTNDQADNSDILIYPNPTSGVIYIENLDFQQVERILIYDLNGRYKERVYPVGNACQINSELNGLYFISIETKTMKTIRPIVFID